MDPEERFHCATFTLLPAIFFAPAGAAKKADGSDPKSFADAMRSKGGTNSMAAMDARPPPAGAAKKADGSDPKSTADAMRSKGGTEGGTNSMAAMDARPPPAGAAKKADGSDPKSAADAMRSKGGKAGNQNAKGRRTGVRKCSICDQEGNYAKTCSKAKADGSKSITSFFEPA